MLEWLTDSLHNGSDLALGDVATRLGVSFLFGLVVAGVYLATQRKQRVEVASLATTLVLLTILITMVTVVIGNNVARAFSLVGALAIVRFRTVVEDTRDTAFVMFAVIVGMGVGAGYTLVPLVGIPVVAVAALLCNGLGRPGIAARDFTLTIRLGIGRDPAALVREAFDKHLAAATLRATATARQGAAIELVYAVQLRDGGDGIALVSELNQLEGMQSVELRAA
jgi:hypothetical protein